MHRCCRPSNWLGRGRSWPVKTLPSTPLHPLRGVFDSRAVMGCCPPASSRFGSKPPLPHYADVRLYIPVTHRYDAGTHTLTRNPYSMAQYSAVATKLTQTITFSLGTMSSSLQRRTIYTGMYLYCFKACTLRRHLLKIFSISKFSLTIYR